MSRKSSPKHQDVSTAKAYEEADTLVTEIAAAVEAPAPKSDPEWVEYAVSQPFVQDIQRRVDRKADKIAWNGDTADVTLPSGAIARVQLESGVIVRCAIKKK